MPLDHWVTAFPVSELPKDGLKPFKFEGQQVAIGSIAGELTAIGNRCPHEGYPLHQGVLKECVLTCAWHNWKFDLRDGSNLTDGEGLTLYPVRVVDGSVQVDLQPPDPEIERPRKWASLDESLRDHATDRGLRDAARLMQLGATPDDLLNRIVRYDARHAEYGTTHVLPLAVDCAKIAARLPGTRALYAVAPVLDLCGETNLRLGPRTHSEAVPMGDVDALRRAVEFENVELAEGIARGLVTRKWTAEAIADAVWHVLADHFTDFGHPLIYATKLREVWPKLAPKDAADVLGALAVRVTWATREDTLPYLRGWTKRWAAGREELLAANESAADDDAPFDPRSFRDAVLEGGPKGSFEALATAMRGGVPPSVVARACVGAAAHRLLRFDPAIDADPGVAEGWLSATHRLTFAAAVRHAADAWDSPRRWDLILQSVAFTASGRPMDAPVPARTSLDAADRAEPRDVVTAISNRDPDAAVAAAAHLLARREAVADLSLAMEDAALSDRYVRPIRIAHGIKTTLAAFEEHAAMPGHVDRDIPVLATARYLAVEVHERPLAPLVKTAVEWVVEGKMPRKLTQ